MKLFTIGPVQMYQRTLDVQAKMVPYFRTQEFSNVMFRIDKAFKKIVGTSEESKVIYMTNSGTGAMEATIDNLFDKNDKLLIINGGTFGKRFVSLVDRHYIPYDEVTLTFGETLSYHHLEPFAKNHYSALLVNLDETSIGQLYDISLLSKFAKEHNMLLVVDAISTLFIDPYYMDKYGIDVTIVSSQKGLCLAPGISMVVLNQKALAKMENIKANIAYFDFKDYLKNMERGQTPFTPAVGLLFELLEEVEYIANHGVEARVKEVEERAKYFRSKLVELNFLLPDYPLSNAVTPCILPEEYASELFAYLKDKHDIFINPCGGPYASRMIRVSHVGDLHKHDYDELIACIKQFQKEYKK